MSSVGGLDVHEAHFVYVYCFDGNRGAHHDVHAVAAASLNTGLVQGRDDVRHYYCGSRGY